MAAVASMFIAAGTPAAAQCNPSYDPLCGETPGAGPDVAISPDGGEYQTDPQAGPLSVQVTAVVSDPDGVDPATLQVSLWTAGSSHAVTMTPAVTSSISFRARGTIFLSTAGDSVLVVQARDKLGNVGSSRRTFVVKHNDLYAPLVSPESHHNEYRNTNVGAFTLPYNVASYTSGGVARSLALVYNSEHARPSISMHLDARPEPRTAQNVHALSLRMQYWTADGSDGTQAGSEMFHQKWGSSFQRLAWRSDTNSLSGAYKYAAVVRSFFADGGRKDTRHFVRFLLLNERNSRYGAGWSVAGIQRLHNHLTTDGWVLNEGNGIARFFAKGAGCGLTSLDCTYVTPAGDFTRLVYRASSKTYLRTYPDGSTVTFSENGLMTQVSDPFGNATTVEWQQTQDTARVWVLSRVVDPIGYATTFTFGPDGYLKTITSPGRTTTFVHNASRQLTSISGPVTYTLGYNNTTEHLLTSYTVAYPTGSAHTWEVAYDTHRKVSSIKAPTVNVNGVQDRPAVSFVSIEVLAIPKPGTGTSLMNPVAPIPVDEAYSEVRDPEGHVTRATMDRYGNPLKIVNDAGTVTYKWTAAGLPSLVSTPQQTSTWSWSSSGQLLQQSVGSSVVYQAAYDSDGRLSWESSQGQTSWYAFGPRGELLRSWYGEAGDAQRTATTFAYNSRYQLIRVVDPQGGKREWSYEGNPWRNPDYTRVTLANGSVATMSFAYDGRSRTTTITSPDGTITTEYDDLDRTVRVVDQANRVLKYEYHGANLSKVIDPADKAFEFSFNALGWLESEKLPGSPRSRTYRYNRDGLLVGRTDRRDLPVTQSWDSVHRPLQQVADGVTTNYSYPDAYTMTVSNDVVTRTVRFLQTGTGALASQSWKFGARRYEVRPVYGEYGVSGPPTGRDLKFYVNDALVRTDSIVYPYEPPPPGFEVGFQVAIRDFAGRTSFVSADTAGRPAHISFGNGILQSHTYNAEGLVASTSFNVASVHQRLGATFAYDTMGRLTNRTSATSDRIWTYGYDQVGQLTNYSSMPSIPFDCNPATMDCSGTTGLKKSESYLYDASGNRNDSGAVFQAGSNRYANFKTFAFEYDAEGNITRKYATGFDQRLVWNSLGQLASVTTNGVTVSYGYDDEGRRVRRTANGQARYFIYDHDDLLQETDANGDPLRTYTHWGGSDRPHSVRLTSGGSSETYYYVLEQPGHVAAVLDSAGGVADHYRYTPWGEIESATNATGQPLRFMGRELDSDTGLYNVRNRWYDPVVARFISEDPIGLAGGTNTYAYALNNPISFLDPSGLQTVECPTPESCPCTNPTNCEMDQVKLGPVRPCPTNPRIFDVECHPYWSFESFTERNRLALGSYHPGDFMRSSALTGVQGNARPEAPQSGNSFDRQLTTARCMATTAWEGLESAGQLWDEALKVLGFVGLVDTTINVGREGRVAVARSGLVKPNWGTVFGKAAQKTVQRGQGLLGRAMYGAARNPWAVAAVATAAAGTLNVVCYDEAGNFDHLP